MILWRASGALAAARLCSLLSLPLITQPFHVASATPAVPDLIAGASAVPPTLPCCGDCDGDGVVTRQELQACMDFFLGNAQIGTCPACDCDQDGVISIDEILLIVINAANGCPAPTPTPLACIGDCNADRAVTVDELLAMVNIALENEPVSPCEAGDANGDGQITIDEILTAVNNALDPALGCAYAGSTFTPTATLRDASPTLTPTPTLTPSATPPPSPATRIRYRLLSASVLFLTTPQPAPCSIDGDSLSGTFEVVPSEPVEGNALLHFAITKIEFRGARSTVTGNMGDISALVSTGRIEMTAAVSINGQQVELSGETPLSLLSDSYPPTFGLLEVCGAPGRATTCDAVSACIDGGYSLFIVAAPEATQTPLPTRTPSPTVVIRYRLTEGSTILSSPAPLPIKAPTYEEPLSGTFVAVPEPPGPLNTLLRFPIASFAFQSSQFTLTGTTGYMEVTTFDPDHVFMTLTGSINGQTIILNGSGPFDDTGSYPPAFGAIEVCGAPPGQGGSCAGIRAGTDVGYDLTIFAAPDG